MSDSLRTLGLQHARLLCPSLSPGVCSNSCPLSQWCSLTISYSTTPLSPVAFNLSQHQGLFQWVGPWFMDLTFQVPVQYHSLQRWTLLSPPDTSTTKHHFRFGPAASFFLELLVIALCSSPVAYWAPSDIGSSSYSVVSFCLFRLFIGFSQQEYWVGCHFLLQLTMFCQNSPPWSICFGWSWTHGS